MLLEKFSIFYNDEETNLDHDIIKDFKHSWRLFDINANVRMRLVYFDQEINIH